MDNVDSEQNNQMRHFNQTTNLKRLYYNFNLLKLVQFTVISAIQNDAHSIH